MKKPALSFLFLMLFFTLQAQDFSIRDKRAISYYLEADKLAARKVYDGALHHLERAIDREKNFLEAYAKQAEILLLRSRHVEALQRLETGARRFTLNEPDQGVVDRYIWAKYQIALALGGFDTLPAFFERYASNLERHLPQLVFEKEEKRIAFIAENMHQAIVVDKERLPAPINKFTFQYFPVLTADSKQLIFVKRDGMDHRQDEDIYTSFYREESKSWTEPFNISSNINSRYNEGTSTISADGTILIFTSCDAPDSQGSCDLYISYRKDGEWTKAKNMGKEVNSRFWDSQPSLSADGSMLFFSSNRPGGYGQNDIWYAVRDQEGNWGEAQNAGPVINTAGNEVSPFIYFNNERLFFSSDGHLGFGGYDLFKSELMEGAFIQPQNIGYPINDQNDQLSLFITAQSDYAYYTESLVENEVQRRSFLYRFRFPQEAISLGTPIHVVRGRVFDEESGQPIGARLSLINLNQDSVLYTFQADTKTGEFMMLYPSKEMTGLYVESKGYLPGIYNLQKIDFSQLVKENIVLVPVGSGKSFVFENVFFDFDRFSLKEASKTSLRKLVTFLQDNPTLSITITGHTDNVGAPAYNKDLSLRRAQSVRDYLIMRGISESRLQAKGVGDSEPIRSNETAEGRAFNRRISILIN
ncbi:MAG: OmpA family protein [Nitritalea sp.]